MKSRSTIWESSPAWKAAVGLASGAYVAAFIPDGWAVAPIVWVVFTLGIGVLLVLFRYPSRLSSPFVAGLLACAMIGSAKYLVDRERLPSLAAEGRTHVRIVARVADDPETMGKRLQFTCAADGVLTDSVIFPFSTNVLVTCSGRGTDAPDVGISYGMKLVLDGTLERPPLGRNPGEMSMRAYYEALGITHVLEVHGAENIVVLEPEGGSWWMRSCIYPARRWMLAVFERTTHGEEGEFLKGLILGERGGLSVMTREAFVNAGVAHVLAVSGSNVAVVAAVLFLVLDVLRVPRRVRVIPMLGGLMFYMLVTGSQPPVVRATIMAAVILLGRSLQRPVNAWNCLGVSAIIIFAIDARQVFDVGFQLSYGAVISLMALYPVLNGWIALIPARFPGGRLMVWLLRVCAVSLSATLGTLPLTASSFGRVSIIGIVANIVVVPATELSVLLGSATLGAALVNDWLAHTYGALNWFVLHWTLVLTHLAGFSTVAYIDTAWFVPFDAVPYFIVLTAAFLRSARRFQHLTFALLTSALLETIFSGALSDVKKPNHLRVSIVDVGQGDAVVVEMPGRESLLIDAGPRSATFDAGSKTVLPFLKRMGIHALDLLVITHAHADHVGGLPSVVSGMEVRRMVAVTPESVRAGLGALWQEAFPPIDSCIPGQPIDLTRTARVYVLYPLPGLAAGRLGGNESLVLKIVYGSVSLLLTGDAETTEESLIIGKYGPFLHSDFLKAGHHGSRTSSSDRFLDLVQPRAVSISVGRHNKFRHPSPSIIARMNSRGIDVYRTDEQGALVFESDGRVIWKAEWR